MVVRGIPILLEAISGVEAIRSEVVGSIILEADSSTGGIPTLEVTISPTTTMVGDEVAWIWCE